MVKKSAKKPKGKTTSARKMKVLKKGSRKVATAKRKKVVAAKPAAATTSPTSTMAETAPETM